MFSPAAQKSDTFCVCFSRIACGICFPFLSRFTTRLIIRKPSKVTSSLTFVAMQDFDAGCTTAHLVRFQATDHPRVCHARKGTVCPCGTVVKIASLFLKFCFFCVLILMFVPKTGKSKVVLALIDEVINLVAVEGGGLGGKGPPPRPPAPTG